MTGTIQEPGKSPQTVRLNLDEIKGEDDVVTVTADYTIEGKTTVLADASGTALTVTLPPAIDSTDRRVYVKKIDGSANTVIVDGNGSETVDGVTASTITAQYGHRMLICDGEQWWRFD
jgi:hypothetical protein